MKNNKTAERAQYDVESKNLVSLSEAGGLDKKIRELTEKLHKKRVDNSNQKTPTDRVKKKGDYDIVEEDYMRAELDRQFIWSYVPMTSETLYMKVSYNNTEYQVPYAEKTLGYLEIIDNGIVRKFPAPGFQLYMFRKDMPKTPDNILNPELTVRGAISRGLSFAINRLTRIADDIYRKTATEYELKKSLQKELEKLLKDVPEEPKAKILSSIKEYGEIKNIPERIAINIINYIKQL